MDHGMGNQNQNQIRVIKLGGSLIEYGRAIIRTLRDFAAEKNLTLIIIPVSYTHLTLPTTERV